MVDKDLCELILILDESGSMGSIRDTVISKINEFVDEQAKLPGKATITIKKFSTSGNDVFLCENVPIGEFKHLTKKTYTPDGMTALLDAIGSTFDSVGRRYRKTEESKRPGKVYVAIMTDGAENNSFYYTHDRVSKMIKEQQEKYSWKIDFLGSGISADIGIQMGIASSHSFSHTSQGYASLCSSLIGSASNFRKS